MESPSISSQLIVYAVDEQRIGIKEIIVLVLKPGEELDGFRRTGADQGYVSLSLNFKGKVKSRKVGQMHYPGQVREDSLEPYQRYVVHVVCEGYEEERREVVLLPGRNSQIFFMGRAGSEYYRQGGVRIPFRREGNRVLILEPRGEKQSPEELERMVKRHKAFDLASLTYKKAADSRGKSKEKPLKASKPWHHGFVRAELEINEEGEQRKNSLKRLHASVQKQPGVGKLALMLDERESGASMFAGEIELHTAEGLERKEINALAKRYGLRYLDEAGKRYHFELASGPDYDFSALLDQIVKENPKILAAEPIVEAVLELDTRVVPQDYLYALQWDQHIIQVPEAWWDIQQNGGGVVNQYGSNTIVIGVADPDGVEVTHPDLSGNVNGLPKLVAAYDFPASSANIVAGLTGTHGTNCAGSATAKADNVSAVNPAFFEGTAGSAPGCRFVGVRINNAPQQVEMYSWYIGLRVTNPVQLTIPVDVTTNSYGSAAVITAAERAFLDFASDFGRLGRGIVMCYSAGNSNAAILGMRPLAAYNRTICVTATTLSISGTLESRAAYSNFGVEADVCAPSDNRVGAPNVLHAPPNNYGAVTTTVTNAVAVPGGFWDGNLPGVPGLVGAVIIRDTINAATVAGSPTLPLNNNPAQFAGVTSVLVDGVNSPTVEGLQVTGTVTGPPTHMLNVQYDGNFANTQQAHNLGVTVEGGSGDYSSSFGGTSHSTPLTSGVVALMLSVKPTLSWVELRELLRISSRKVNVGEMSPTGRWIDPSLTPPNDTVLNAALTDVRPKSPAVSTTLAANALAPVDPLPHKNHDTSVLKLTSVAGFAVGDAIRISKGAVREYHIVESINVGTNELTIDALQANFTTSGTGTTVVAGGVRPIFSQFYGFGRVNAAKAVVAARTYDHAHRDLMIRNTMTDTGLVDIVAPATPIHSPDIWIRNQADPAMPAPPYDQTAPHQNPQSGVNRFIYARIKNIGTQQSSLNAWVHFYVALSDHNAPPADPNANPTNITTPFLFPGDFNSANATIQQKSWCDDANNDITLPAPNGIVSGSQKVYHVQDTTVPAVFNQLIPAGSVAKADANNVNTGVTVVRVQWNQANLPPAGTAFGIYLLAYVSPVDGARQGHEAGRNNNMSYREIAFADFSLLDGAGVAPLASSVNVDEFGTPVSTNFTMRVQQAIGSMMVDRVVIEISRTSDSGTVERGFFRKNGAVWQLEDIGGLTGTITWANLTAPVLTGTATAATGNQQDISFAGLFSSALQHHKVSFKAVIHSARAGATLVPIAEESFDVMVIANVPATPSASATDPAPPVPDSFVFTDFATLATQTSASKSFGPINADRFRITSVFTAAAAPKAYALCAGVVMVQVVDANRVNLVLRPLKQAGLGMTPVKYYIYRGLRRDDFFNAAFTEVRPALGAKDFIARLWPVFLALNPSVPAFPSEALGYDSTLIVQHSGAEIDEYFFGAGSNFQFALVKAGEYMADFYHDGGNEFGLDIVLEEGTTKLTFQDIRDAAYIIDVGALPETNDTERFTKRLAREKILNFLDPAAFYAMHHAGTVRRKPSGTWTGQAIVTNIVDKFFTKRAVYIDIRNENGNSYNFYQNYKGPTGQPDSGKNIQHGVVAGSLTSSTYGASEWPIQIVNLTHNTPDAVNPLLLHLRWDDNLKPVLYSEHGTITSANINNKFVDENQLFTQPPPYTQQWTNVVTFSSPNTGTVPSKQSIAWLFKLHYGRIIDPLTVWPATVVQTNKTTDNLFGPIDIEALWSLLAPVRWISAQDRKYVDGQLLGFGQVMERGAAFEGDSLTGRVVFYAALMDQHLNPVAGFTPRRGITGGTSDGVSFLQAARQFDQYRLEFGKLQDGVDSITTLRFVPGAVVNAGSANGMMFLGITVAELTALQNLAGLNENYQRTICIEDVGIAGIGKKYQLGVQGLQADGTYAKVMPTPGNEIFAYSLEGMFFYSDAFSGDEPLPSTYTRNVEEAVGLQNLPTIGSANFKIHSVVSGANGQFRIAGDLRQKITRGGKFQVTGNANNNGTYTVATITYASGSKITTLQVSNVPGNSTSGSLQLLPRAIEEHFIELDPGIALAGTNPMKTIVDGFATAVDAVPNDNNALAALQGHVENFGSQVLARTRAAVRDSGHANPDDRPLYWARLKMMVILKSHEYLLQNIADRDTLVKLLDERSRGIAPAPNFSAAAGSKKVLVVGFDPFFLVPGQPNNNSYQSNPSGVAALFLHGATEIPGMFIQSVIVPVRYEDFDAGMIDNLVDPYLHGANALDMILSISQDVDLRFHVDRFATRSRTTTTPDNMGVSGKLAVHYELDGAQTALIRLASNANLPRYLETTLPVMQLVPGSNMTVAATGSQIVKTVIFDQKFTLKGSPEQGEDNIGSTYSAVIPPAGVDLEKGSGGNYLSNELFYRIAWRRAQRVTTLKTGHLHVPKLQQASPPSEDAKFDPLQFQYYVDTIIQILKDAVPGL